MCTKPAYLTPFSGLEIKILRVDTNHNISETVLRFSAGTTFPLHLSMLTESTDWQWIGQQPPWWLIGPGNKFSSHGSG